MGVGLKTLGKDVFEEIAHATGIAPFVVVPAYQFKELAVKLHSAAFIKNRRSGAMDEIAGDHFICRGF